MAAFRYGLIAPIVQGTFTDPSIKAYCQRIVEKSIPLPDGREVFYSYKTLEKWAELYRKGGLDALEPTSRSDKGSIRVLSQDAIDEILHIKAEFPRLNALQIHSHLLRKNLISYPVSARSVQRFIKNHNLKAGLPDVVTRDRKAFEMPHFADLWEADTCHFPHFKENGKVHKLYLLAIVDDHSRLVVAARFFYEDNAYNFQLLLKQAVSMYGIPLKLYLDSGAPYKNSQLNQICSAINTILIHAPIRDGAAKAKIERFFGVAKSRWLYATDLTSFHSLDELNGAFADYVRLHNTTINSSTAKTPMERFLATRNKARTPKSEQWLDDCFMNRISRKVKNDATLSMSNRLFDAQKQFIGRTVEVRFLPGHLDEAYILDNGHKFPLRLTNKEENARTKRDNPLDYSKMGGEL
jgi:transposase InsO family protein